MSQFDPFLAAIQKELPAGGSAEFEPYSDEELELSSLEATTPGKGWGTQAMNTITRLADEFGVNLMVIPAGNNRAEAEPLTKFYERFGFEGEDALHRPARK